MTTTVEPVTPPTVDPLQEAVDDVAGVPESFAEVFSEPEQKVKELVIVNWSGDLDKVWPVLILSSTAAASGVRCRVFVTFWGLLPFVKDGKRIVGENWMQKMLTLMQRPGIDHLKLSKMNFLGMGPWMMGSLRRKYNVASPRELLEAATAMGVEFIPCQM
ncbi:MAG TPA: DsrE/DsrF/DrsH-like family protein, partial [Candidatus Limnocylindria bacterium]|nr:DsrE/DsrF/DrsH-like family protein [Candidatus Limnocylindria bacterium]